MIHSYSSLDNYEQDANYEQYYFQQKLHSYIELYDLQSYASYLDDLISVGYCPAQVDKI